MALIPTIIKDDWTGLNRIVRKLASTKLGPTASPTFAGLTLTGLTATRLMATDGSKGLASTDLISWVAGTADEINVADDGDGTITIGIVDPLIVGKGGTGLATLTDHGILLGSGTGAVTPLAAATDGQIPIGSTGADPVLATIAGSANRVIVINLPGIIALTGPQDIHTGASPTFAGLSIGTLSLAGGSITDSTGAISFGDENLTTSGKIASGEVTVSGSAAYGVRINQGGDYRGLQIYGYDDLAASYVKLEIRSWGVSAINSSGALYLRISNVDVGFFSSSAFSFNDDKDFRFGGHDNYAVIRLATGQTNASLMIGLNSVTDVDGFSRSLIICERSDIGYDFAHATQTNPTIFVHSANQSTTEWINFQHDQTDGIIQTGTGDLNLNPAGSTTIGDGGTTNYTSISATGILDNTVGTLTLGAGVTTFTITSNVMAVTGNGGGNTIATITGAGRGTILTLIFVDGLITVTDDNSHAANSIDLSAAFTSADDTVLQLMYDGTSWYEVSRSVN